MRDHDEIPTSGRLPLAEQPTKYDSPAQSIALAHETMRNIKEALTADTDGKFPAKYADVDWNGLNMQPPKTAWQEMDMEQRYDLLLHALDQSIWSLEPPVKWNEPSDSQKLANEFVKDEERQLHAELRHDYGLRFLEDRGVTYEDESNRTLDQAIARGTVEEHDGPASSPTTPERPSQTRPVWPSEIARANRDKQPAQNPDKSKGHESGHDAGLSM